MKLSEKIYTCRKRKGLSQEALAERLGVSRQAVSKWETGDAEPELAKLRALAAAFGVSADWLLSEEEPAEPAQTPALNDAPPPAADSVPPHSGDWLDKLPNTISTLLRRYGWLLGVRIAIGGALFIGIGAVAKAIANSMFAGFGSSVNTMGGLVMGGGYTVDVGGGLFNTGISMFNPVSTLATFIIWLGVIMLVGGIALAIALKKLDKK